jgi:hypothetical protein
MAYDYPFVPTVVQDDVDFALAEHHNKQGTQLRELTDAVKALDDFKDLFPPIVGGDAGKALVVNGTEDGYEHAAAGGGYTEPGLLCFTEPEYVQDWWYGFDPMMPLIVVTHRALTIDEVIRLRLLRSDIGPPVEINPGIVVDEFSVGDFFATYVWFDTEGETIIPIEGYEFPSMFKVHLLVYDTATSAWVDGMTIDYRGPFL